MLQIPLVATSHLLGQLSLQPQLGMLSHCSISARNLLSCCLVINLWYPHSSSDTCANPEVPGS